MNNEFKQILENIEASLNKALPQTSSGDAAEAAGWTPASFGTLPQGASAEYID